MIPPLNRETIELAGTVIAALLTLWVFSYLLGDMPGVGSLFKFFYRLALHVLIGVSVTYALLVAVFGVLAPALLGLAATGASGALMASAAAALGLMLGALLILTKLYPPLAWLGNYSTAFLIGVGMAVAAAGATMGTLYAQSRATAILAGQDPPLVLLLGALVTLAVLISFSFTATWRKGPWGVAARVVQGISVVGRFFVYVTLGVVFAGVYVASVSVLIGRAQWLLSAFNR